MPTQELETPDPPTADTPPKTNGTTKPNQEQQHIPPKGSPSSGTNGAGKEKKRRKSQGGRLRSYVLPEREDDPDETEPDSDAAKQRSEVELAGINMVVEDEKRLGCEPEVMPPLNEGFDIISRDPDGNILRYIEVKSVSGEWGDMGVGLTSAEFAMAQLKKEQYWLYVVENSLDEEPQIHRIQDPANRVDRFQFDEGWQGAAEQDERKLYPPEGY